LNRDELHPVRIARPVRSSADRARRRHGRPALARPPVAVGADHAHAKAGNINAALRRLDAMKRHFYASDYYKKLEAAHPLAIGRAFAARVFG
jgi:hypothetical protein